MSYLPQEARSAVLEILSENPEGLCTTEITSEMSTRYGHIYAFLRLGVSAFTNDVVGLLKKMPEVRNSHPEGRGPFKPSMWTLRAPVAVTAD